MNAQNASLLTTTDNDGNTLNVARSLDFGHGLILTLTDGRMATINNDGLVVVRPEVKA